ncbi:hypothetical protein [Photorhabdus sp. SF281]
MRQQWEEEQQQEVPIEERGHLDEDDLWQYDEPKGDWVKWEV